MPPAPDDAGLRRELEHLRAEADHFRAGLLFYATPAHWSFDGRQAPALDGGEQARLCFRRWGGAGEAP
jgi:hypothetical protein